VIKPEPASFADLLAELQVERFGDFEDAALEKFRTAPPVQWWRPSTRAEIQKRRRKLCEAIDGYYIDDVPEPRLAVVVPIRGWQAAA
jgi:hypothetical protein